MIRRKYLTQSGLERIDQIASELNRPAIEIAALLIGKVPRESITPQIRYHYFDLVQSSWRKHDHGTTILK